jgi:hypothetical protein
VPKHIEVTFITPQGPVATYQLKPKDTIQVEVKYDANAANDYGFVYHLLKIQTNDATEPEKPFYVTANIEEYFGELTEAAAGRSPSSPIRPDRI